MNHSRLNFLLFGIFIVLIGSGCNYPGRSTAPTPVIFPTQNQTLTAIFQPTSTVAATQTPQVLPPSPTSTQVVEASPIAPSPSPTATEIPPSPTPKPTSTPVSYAGPGKRSGPSMVAAFLNQKPTLDGSFDEWDLDKFRIENVVFGKSNWSDASDLFGRAMLGWDETNLYLAVRVADDRYVQLASGDKLYLGDSLDMLIDTNVSKDYYLGALDGDDFQIGVSPGSPEPGKEPEAYLWSPKSLAGTQKKVKIGAMLVDDGYRVEVAIPWSILGVNPRAGQHFGFALSISDNDKAKSKQQQSMVSYVSRRDLTDPTTWGDLTLASGSTGQRTGVSVQAAYINNAPVMDGNLGQWSADRYAVDKVVFGADKWANANDLSGRVMVVWNEEFLFLGVKVVDQNYAQNARGADLFLGDSLEVLFDSDVGGDFSLKSLSADDYQLGVSPGRPSVGTNMEAYLWFPKDEAGTVTKVKIGAIATTDGYNVEIAIPWSLFGVTPARGDRFGFAFSISDNDNPDRDQQQSMVSNVSTRKLTDPTTWGDLTLVKP